MRFTDLRNELKNIVFIMIREESSDYFEAVIARSELSNLALRLEKFLGPPIWPSQTKLSEEVEGSIRDYGGIMPDQDLYFRKQDTETVIAMLWPWSNGTHITVKIANT